METSDRPGCKTAYGSGLHREKQVNGLIYPFREITENRGQLLILGNKWAGKTSVSPACLVILLCGFMEVLLQKSTTWINECAVAFGVLKMYRSKGYKNSGTMPATYI